MDVAVNGIIIDLAEIHLAKAAFAGCLVRRSFLERLSPDTSELSVAVQWRLVDEVFGDSRATDLATLLMMMTAVLSTISGGSSWLMGCGIASLLVRAARSRLARSYAGRNPQDLPALWAWRYAFGAWASAVLWAALGMIVLTDSSGYIQFLAITVQTALLIGGAVRNSSVPQAALGQNLITLCPFFVACLLTGRIEYQLYSVLILLEVYGAYDTTLSVCRRTAKLLRTEEAMAGTCARLAEANERLASLALTDGLTGALNRRGLDEAMDREFRRAQREHACLSLVLFDIDHFKLLNDSRGHLVGDDYLRRVAACLQTHAQRPGDLVARYGGEEFAVLLADTDVEGAIRTADRLRGAVEALALPHPYSPFGVLTVSGGAVTGRPEASDLAEMLSRADKALYAAKANGRNRVRNLSPCLPAAMSPKMDSDILAA